jgi:hypothetical protein
MNGWIIKSLSLPRFLFSLEYFFASWSTGLDVTELKASKLEDDRLFIANCINYLRTHLKSLPHEYH